MRTISKLLFTFLLVTLIGVPFSEITRASTEPIRGVIPQGHPKLWVLNCPYGHSAKVDIWHAGQGTVTIIVTESRRFPLDTWRHTYHEPVRNGFSSILVSPSASNWSINKVEVRGSPALLADFASCTNIVPALEGATIEVLSVEE